MPPRARVQCKPPTLIDTTGYNATTGLSSTDDGSRKDASTDAMIPTVGKFMMDMMVMAFACEITAVGAAGGEPRPRERSGGAGRAVRAYTS